MKTKHYCEYIKILSEELVAAMGCTEPIAIALCAARAAELIDGAIDKVEVSVSGNIIKNVKSVMVPNTGGLRGIKAAVAAGIVAGDPKRELEVLSGIGAERQGDIAKFIEEVDIKVSEADTDRVLEIGITVFSGSHRAYAKTVDSHTGLCLLEKDGEVIFSSEADGTRKTTDHSVLSIAEIIEFADCADIDDVKEILDRQIAYNTAIAKEGLTGKYGAAIGRTLLLSYGDTVHNRAKAWAAAGSDARMSG